MFQSGFEICLWDIPPAAATRAQRSSGKRRLSLRWIAIPDGLECHRLEENMRGRKRRQRLATSEGRSSDGGGASQAPESEVEHQSDIEDVQNSGSHKEEAAVANKTKSTTSTGRLSPAPSMAKSGRRGGARGAATKISGRNGAGDGVDGTAGGTGKKQKATNDQRGRPAASLQQKESRQHNEHQQKQRGDVIESRGRNLDDPMPSSVSKMEEDDESASPSAEKDGAADGGRRRGRPRKARTATSEQQPPRRESSRPRPQVNYAMDDEVRDGRMRYSCEVAQQGTSMSIPTALM